MKTKIVPGADIDPAKGLRAQDYVDGEPTPYDFVGMNRIAQHCYETAQSKGWWEDYEGRSLTKDELASKLCLIHSEVSEALEEVRENDCELYFTAPKQPHDPGRPIIPESEHGKWKLGDLKPEGLPSELADILIRVFDLAGKQGIDIAKVTQQKMAYNEHRSYRHGGKSL